MVVKVPTAYIVPPHCASCRICSTWLVEAGKCGTLLGGVADTTPAGGDSPPVPACAAGMATASIAAAAANTTRYLFTTSPPVRRQARRRWSRSEYTDR